jgi:ADP-heptose:LPS heptosyltransferase
MMRDPRRVLIVLFGAIGDVTRALPLLYRLRQGFPRAHIAWAVEPLAAPLLDGHPALDERIVFCRERGLPGFLSFLQAVRRRRFDLVLDLGRQLKSGATALASGAPVRLGFHRLNSRECNWLFQTGSIGPQAHDSSKLRQFLLFGDVLGLEEVPVRFGLRPTAEADERVACLLRGTPEPFAALVLGSSCPSRRWLAHRTAETARALWQRYGYASVLVGTAADRRFAAAVRAQLDTPVGDLVGATTLSDAVSLLARAALVLSPDSGAMHIAAAVGTPVVSVWGATSAGRSAPYGSEALSVTGRAGCAPCYLKRCPIGRVCMEEVSVADVLARVAEVVRERARVGP